MVLDACLLWDLQRFRRDRHAHGVDSARKWALGHGPGGLTLAVGRGQRRWHWQLLPCTGSAAALACRAGSRVNGRRARPASWAVGGSEWAATAGHRSRRPSRYCEGGQCAPIVISMSRHATPGVSQRASQVWKRGLGGDWTKAGRGLFNGGSSSSDRLGGNVG